MTLFSQPFWPTLVAFLLCLVATVFVLASGTGSFKMDPAVYGPAVYTVPAIVWALATLSSAALFFAGFLAGGYLGARKTGSILLIIGCAFGASIYAALVAMARTGEFGDLVLYYAGFFFMPLHSVIATWAIVELMRGLNGRNDQ